MNNVLPRLHLRCPVCHGIVIAGMYGKVTGEGKYEFARLSGRKTARFKLREGGYSAVCSGNAQLDIPRHVLPLGFDQLPSISIALAGDSGCGKSTFLAALFYQLENEGEGYTIERNCDQRVSEAFRQLYVTELFKQKQKIAQTTPVTLASVTNAIVIKSRTGKRAMVSFIDLAGDITTTAGPGKLALGLASSIWFIADGEKIAKGTAADMSFRNVLDLAAELRADRQNHSDCLVVAKGDALESDAGLGSVLQGGPTETPESREVYAYLKEKQLLSWAEPVRRWGTPAFVVSATSCPPHPEGNSEVYPFVLPRGVLKPFVYTLAAHGVD